MRGALLVNLSPLNDFHLSAGARMIDFGGWSMPIRYRSITEEHLHTRKKLSVFDVSHMGRFRLAGQHAESFLENICTRKIADTSVGQSKYTHICNQQGRILDDVIVSRHDDYWALVCNASNRQKIAAWLTQHAAGSDVNIVDQTLDTAMLAIQGPLALDFVQKTFAVDLSALKRYWFIDGDFMGMPYTIYRSGYTGEDGAEAVIPSGIVSLVLPLLFGPDLTAEGDCKPAGLGARDTLRLEAAMPLYGQELSEDWDSITAGQAWCVSLDKDFIGADALRKIKADGPNQKIVGLELAGRRIARPGYPILEDGNQVGRITSGTMSPTLQKSIAMGLLDTALAEPGTQLTIDLGRKENPATVVPLPFYKRPKRAIPDADRPNRAATLRERTDQAATVGEQTNQTTTAGQRTDNSAPEH